MRKKVMVKKEKLILSCDLCGKEIETYTRCLICNRELCEECSKDMKHTPSMWYPPCPICIKLKDKYFDSVKKYFDESEELRDKGVGLLNEWGKESKKLRVT